MSFGVVVDFNANLARFTSAVDKATNDLNRFQSNASRISSNIGRAFGALGVGLSVAGFAHFIKSSIDAQDHLNDLSKATRLTVEQLAGLSSASKKSGSDLDGTAKAINKLAKEMGVNNEKFAALGITAKDPLEAFLQLADVMNAIDDPQQRAAVGAAALGKGWETAAPLIAEGSKSIREMIVQGTALSKVTKESAEAADEFNDKWQELKDLTAGWGVAIANPIVTWLLEVNKALEHGIQLSDLWSKRFVQEGSGKPLSRDTGILPIGGGAAAPAAPAGKPSAAAIKKFIGGEGSKDKEPKIDDITKQLRDIAKEWSELGKSGSSLEMFRLQTMGATKEQLALAESLLKTIDAHKEEAAAMDYARGKLKEEQDAMTEAMIERERTITEFTRKASENIQDSLADFLFDPFDNGLRGMLDGFTNMIRRMAAEAAAAQIAQKLFGMGGNLSGGILGPMIQAGLSMFGMGGTQAPAPVRTGSPIPVPGRASGGPVNPYATYLVGERGPELLHMGSSGGNVIPNGRMGGVNVTNQFHITGPVDSRTQMQIAQQAGAAVSRAMRRNG